VCACVCLCLCLCEGVYETLLHALAFERHTPVMELGRARAGLDAADRDRSEEKKDKSSLEPDIPVL